MERRNVINVLGISAILIVLFAFIEFSGYELEKKQNEVNKLQNKVEQQIELIDALQQ